MVEEVLFDHDIIRATERYLSSKFVALRTVPRAVSLKQFVSNQARCAHLAGRKSTFPPFRTGALFTPVVVEDRGFPSGEAQ
jgi:hypothetical protein